MIRTAAVSFALLSVGARAQPYDLPLLALGAGHAYTPEQLFSLDPAGNQTVRAVFPLSFLPNSLAHHHDNRSARRTAR